MTESRRRWAEEEKEKEGKKERKKEKEEERERKLLSSVSVLLVASYRVRERKKSFRCRRKLKEVAKYSFFSLSRSHPLL